MNGSNSVVKVVSFDLSGFAYLLDLPNPLGISYHTSYPYDEKVIGSGQPTYMQADRLTAFFTGDP